MDQRVKVLPGGVNEAFFGGKMRYFSGEDETFFEGKIKGFVRGKWMFLDGGKLGGFGRKVKKTERKAKLRLHGGRKNDTSAG